MKRPISICCLTNQYFSLTSAIILLINVHFISIGLAVPLTPSLPQELDLDSGNNSLLVPVSSPVGGCRYQGSVYGNGEEVPTDEPCLLCQCKTSVVCKLRICPEIPDVPPPGCIIVQRARKCCAKLVCNQFQHGQETNRKLSREHRLPAVNNTLLAASVEGKGCVLDGTVYAEGSAMQSSSLCSYCFCIRGQMKCSSPQCVMPLNGCKPKFRSYACCPTNYDCRESNSTAILKTTPSSIPTPDFLKGCVVNGKRVAEGEPILPYQLPNHTNPCQTCFCMGGKIHCSPLQCDRPIDGCRPILEPGHCCPEKYECDGNPKEVQELEVNPTLAALSLISSTGKLSETEEIKDNPESVNTIGTLAEPLPIPASQKLTTSAAPVQTSTIKPATSIESKSHANSGARSSRPDGSREERRNKDRDDWSSRSSYEDDEKEDSSSLSFEHADLDPSSLSFEDSTYQSASNSEMESDSDISPTEENDDEVVPDTTTEAQQQQQSTTTVADIQNPTASDHNSTQETPLQGRRLSTKNPTGSTPLFTEPTTTESITIDNNNNTKTTNDTITNDDESVSPILLNSLDSNLDTLNISTSDSKSELVVEEMSTSISPDFDMEEFTSTSASIINQDVESMEVSSSSASTSTSTQPTTTTTTTTTTVPTTTISSFPSSSPSETTASPSTGTTVRNVYFIPFGVEDAVLSPLNDKNPSYETIPIQNLASYGKQSLIPPSLNKGYQPVKVKVDPDDVVHIDLRENSHYKVVGEKQKKKDAEQPNQNQSQSQTTILPATTSDSSHTSHSSPSASSSSSSTQSADSKTLPETLKDAHLRNSIMDVPVSTSLYSNGFYRNGIITEDAQSLPLELEIKNPGQVFDDDARDGDGNDDDDHDDSFKVEDARRPVPIPPSNPPSPPTITSHKKTVESNPTPFKPKLYSASPSFSTSIPVQTISDSNNPSRTYSKFGIQDSTYYRYNNNGYNNNNNNNKENPPPLFSLQPAFNRPPPPPQLHHRYYNGPDMHGSEHHILRQSPYSNFRHAIRQNYDMTDDDDETTADYGEDEELGSFEESSVENPTDNENHFNYQKPMNNLNIPFPSSTPPPKYVFAQSTKALLNSGTTKSPAEFLSNGVKRMSGYTASGNTQSSSISAFKPAIAIPFAIPKKSNAGSEFLGLKLSGCNIYGKMYNIKDIIRELSSACVQCLCTEVGVQCSETKKC